MISKTYITKYIFPMLFKHILLCLKKEMFTLSTKINNYILVNMRLLTFSYQLSHSHHVRRTMYTVGVSCIMPLRWNAHCRCIIPFIYKISLHTVC